MSKKLFWLISFFLVLIFVVSCASARWARYEKQVFQQLNNPNISKEEKTLIFTEYFMNARQQNPKVYFAILREAIATRLRDPNVNDEEKGKLQAFYAAELQAYQERRLAQSHAELQELLLIQQQLHNMQAIDAYRQRTLMWK